MLIIFVRMNFFAKKSPENDLIDKSGQSGTNIDMPWRQKNQGVDLCAVLQVGSFFNDVPGKRATLPGTCSILSGGRRWTRRIPHLSWRLRGW